MGGGGARGMGMSKCGGGGEDGGRSHRKTNLVRAANEGWKRRHSPWNLDAVVSSFGGVPVPGCSKAQRTLQSCRRIHSLRIFRAGNASSTGRRREVTSPPSSSLLFTFSFLLGMSKLQCSIRRKGFDRGRGLIALGVPTAVTCVFLGF